MVAIVGGSVLVEVAGADEAVLNGFVEFSFFDDAYFGMHLHVGEAEEDFYALFFELLFPAHISFFIEAGAELENDGNLLAIAHGIYECIDDLGVAGDTVEGYADALHKGIDSGLAEEIDNGIEGVIGEMEHYIAPLYDLHNAARLLQQGVNEGGRATRVPGEDG